jgi:hypothetical protein
LHERLVLDDQPTVPHTVYPMFTVGVAAIAPKFRPITVTDAAPVVGEFQRFACDTPGASYEKDAISVAIVDEIVSVTLRPLPMPDCEIHLTCVSLVHTLVMHTDAPSLTVGVVLVCAKLLPCSEITAFGPAVVAVLPAWSADSTGESYEKLPASVPSTDAIVSVSCTSEPAIVGGVHESDVSDDQPVVMQTFAASTCVGE